MAANAVGAELEDASDEPRFSAAVEASLGFSGTGMAEHGEGLVQVRG